jgi:hypothetical protein
MLSQNTIIQMFDKDILISEETLVSFVEKNQDNEEMLDAIHLLKHFGEIQITTDAGDLTLTLKLKD